MAFSGDDDETAVPYTVTYSVILITEHALVLVTGASTGSTSTVVALSGDDVVESGSAAMLTSGGASWDGGLYDPTDTGGPTDKMGVGTCR